MQQNSITEECARRTSALCASELRKRGCFSGPVQVGTANGDPIIAELLGPFRNFPDGPHLPDDQLPHDPNLLRAQYTVLKVVIGNEIVLHSGWSDRGWFGYIKRGHWEADLVWAFI